MSNLPYSYHTFLFPFIWKTDTEITREEFEKNLPIGSKWIECKWEDIISSEKYNESSEKNKNEWFQNYQANQYFTDAANNAIFNLNDKNVVKCFEYYKRNGEYIITKSSKDYRLNINKIRLNIYDAGIAMLIFELENKRYKTLDEVNAVNEFGRRINLPFLKARGAEQSEEEFTHNICADKIELKLSDDEYYAENYKETLLNIHKNIHNGDISTSYIMGPIQDILDGGHNKITANPKHKNKDKFYIKPCVDDRMFVCCMFNDENFSKELQGIRTDGISFLNDVNERLCNVKDEKIVDVAGKEHDSYMEGWSDEETLSSRLYKFLFIETDLTCQDCLMKKELLTASVYRRWINSGTIFGVTHHSLMSVNNGAEAIIPSVINPFLIEYVQMAILTLAQRAVILMLEDEAAIVSNSFSDDVDITMKDLSMIEKLQAKYVKIQNQLLLSEITVQEQGVELYEMLRSHLYIEKNMTDLDNKMNNLRDVANTVHARLERQSDKAKEDHDNQMLKLQKEEEDARKAKERSDDKRFSLLATMLGLVSVVEPFAMLCMLDGQEKAEGGLWLGISILIIAILLIIYKINNNNSNDNNSP